MAISQQQVRHGGEQVGLYGAALVLLNWVVKFTIVAILGVLALVLVAAWRPDLVDLLLN